MARVHDQSIPSDFRTGDYRIPIDKDGGDPAALDYESLGEVAIVHIPSDLPEDDQRDVLLNTGAIRDAFGGLPQASADWLGRTVTNWQTGARYLCINDPHKSSRSTGTFTNVTRDDLEISPTAPTPVVDDYWIDTATWRFFSGVDVRAGVPGWVDDTPADVLENSVETGRTTVHWMGDYHDDQAALDDLHTIASGTTYFYGNNRDGHVYRLTASSFTAAGDVTNHYSWLLIGGNVKFIVSRHQLPQLDQFGKDDNLVCLGPGGELYVVNLKFHQETPNTFTAEDFSATNFDHIGEQTAEWFIANQPTATDATNNRYGFNTTNEVFERPFHYGSGTSQYTWVVTTQDDVPYLGAYDDADDAASHLRQVGDAYYDRSLGQVREVLTFSSGSDEYTSRSWKSVGSNNSQIIQALVNSESISEDDKSSIRENIGIVVSDAESLEYVYDEDPGGAGNFGTGSSGRLAQAVFELDRSLTEDDRGKIVHMDVRIANVLESSHFPVTSFAAEALLELGRGHFSAGAALASAPIRPNITFLLPQNNSQTNLQVRLGHMYYAGAQTATTTISEALDTTETEIDVASVAGISVGDKFYIGDEPSTGTYATDRAECVEVTAVGSGSITVLRAQDDTPAKTASSGDSLYLDDRKTFFFANAAGAINTLDHLTVILESSSNLAAADAELEGNDITELYDNTASGDTALTRAAAPWRNDNDIKFELTRALAEADDDLIMVIRWMYDYVTGTSPNEVTHTVCNRWEILAGDFRNADAHSVTAGTGTNATTLPPKRFTFGGQRTRSGDTSYGGASRPWVVSRDRHADGHDVIRVALCDSGTMPALSNIRANVSLVPRVDALSISGAMTSGSGQQQQQEGVAYNGFDRATITRYIQVEEMTGVVVTPADPAEIWNWGAGDNDGWSAAPTWYDDVASAQAAHTGDADDPVWVATNSVTRSVDSGGTVSYTATAWRKYALWDDQYRSSPSADWMSTYTSGDVQMRTRREDGTYTPPWWIGNDYSLDPWETLIENESLYNGGGNDVIDFDYDLSLYSALRFELWSHGGFSSASGNISGTDPTEQGIPLSATIYPKRGVGWRVSSDSVTTIPDSHNYGVVYDARGGVGRLTINELGNVVFSTASAQTEADIPVYQYFSMYFYSSDATEANTSEIRTHDWSASYERFRLSIYGLRAR